MKKSICMFLSAMLIFSGCAKQEEPVFEKTSFGEYTENTRIYENEYAGFGCVIDENFEVMTKEQVNPSMEEVKERFNNTELNEEIAEANLIFDIQAANLETGANFNIIYQEISKAEYVNYNHDNDRVVELALNKKDEMIQSYLDAGYGTATMRQENVQFLGKNVSAIVTEMTTQGIPIYIVQVPQFDVNGTFGIMLTVTALSMDEAKELLNTFYEV